MKKNRSPWLQEKEYTVCVVDVIHLEIQKYYEEIILVVNPISLAIEQNQKEISQPDEDRLPESQENSGTPPPPPLLWLPSATEKGVKYPAPRFTFW